MCIFFVAKDLYFTKIFYITKEKDLEICALELEPKSFKLNI